MSSQTPDRPPILPRLRQGLIIREDGAPGIYVVKDAASGQFFHLGEEEHYLFSQLDGQRDEVQIRASYATRFGEALSADDLHDFVEEAARNGLLHEPHSAEVGRPGSDAAQASPMPKPSRKQSLLYWRIPFFDPDRLLTWCEPHLRFLFTRGFVGLSIGLVILAAAITFLNRAHWMSAFPDAITWKTVVLVWVLIFFVTLLHEFAHGLTCKYYGGEVHEIGFLLLFFMPCFYCNVSDVWLLGERRKRLWVGAAGIYSDVLAWASATLLWRITAPETSLNYFSWMAATICGGRCFFNFNPLIKLDGYYLLSDAARIPNLFDRGRKRWMQTLRWLLWGGQRPNTEPRGRFLLAYGVASWLFIGMLLWGMVYGLVQLGKQEALNLGFFGVGVALLMPIVIVRNLFRGITGGEVARMLTKRKGRVVVWLVAMVGLPTLAFIVPIQDRVAGTFSVRPSTRVEVNALEAGFLQDIELAEGCEVYPGTPIARVEIPDLEVNLSRKQAEIRESEANLRRLEAGPRPEVVAEQRLGVKRAEDWVALGKLDLARARKAFAEEVVQIEHEILQHEAEVEFGKLSLAHAEKLHKQNALSGEQLQSEKTEFKIAMLKLDYSRAHKRSREAEGTVAAEAELARREKQLADERSELTILEAGGRPEEVDAERARLARLTEELKYLEHLKSRVVLRSPVAGIITTPRMHEKNGQYAATGTVVCIIEDLSEVAAEIAVSELSVLKVQPGQLVELRARGLPMQTFHAKVERTAPSAVVPTTSGTPSPSLAGKVVVYCRLSQSDAKLLSGMTGFARIYGEQKTIGEVFLGRVIRYLRTEFWLW